MELTKDEKKVIKFILQRQLKEFRRDETTRDWQPVFLKAEEDYEKFLENLINKF